MKYVIHYLIAFVVFLGVDAIWLGFIARNLYANAIGHLMTDKVNWLAAFVFYLIFVVGVLIFVVEPAIISQDVKKLIFHAAMFGLITYSTYDLTNLATLKDWPISITLIDLLWGTSLSVIVAFASYHIILKL